MAAASSTGGDGMGLDYAVDAEFANNSSSDDSSSSDDDSSSVASGGEGHEAAAGMQLASGSARKRARVDDGEAEPVAAAAAGEGSGSDSDAEEQAVPEKKPKKPVSEAKKAKLKALKEAKKARNQARFAEKASADASIIEKRPEGQAEELWDFVLKHKTVHLSELEVENLKLKNKHIQRVHSNVRMEAPPQTEKPATGRRKHRPDVAGVRWPSAMKAVVPGWKDLVAAGGKGKENKGKKPRGLKRGRDDAPPPPKEVDTSGSAPTGSPFVIILSTSARRCVAVRHALVPLHWKVAKLFAKHMKQQEQGELVSSAIWHAGVGTASRVTRLLEDGYLLPDRLVTLVLDSAPNPKGQTILTQHETQSDVADLLVKHILPLTAAGKMKIAIV